jgi:hypothetical protein
MAPTTPESQLISGEVVAVVVAAIVVQAVPDQAAVSLNTHLL